MRNQEDSFSLILNLGSVVFVGIAALWMLFFTGCSSTPKQVKVARDQARVAYELQKPVVVMTSKDDKRPEWVKRTFTEDEDAGLVVFSGAFLNGSDYAVSVRCANAEALKVGVQAVGQFIRAEFTEYVHGSNTGDLGVERYVSDGLATFADCLQVQGVRQAEVYYEETFSPSIMQPTYNVFVRLEMAKVDYLKAKADVLRRLRDRFRKDGNTEAKEKADQLLDQLKSQVRNGA